MRAINNLMVKITYLIITAIIVVLMYEVIARSLFNASTTWYLEVASLLGACGATLAAAYVLQEEAHLGVDFVIEHLPQKWHNLMLFITSIFGLIITIIIVIMLGIETVWSFKMGRLTDNAMLSFSPFQAVSNLGLLLFAVQFGVRAKKYYRKWKETS